MLGGEPVDPRGDLLRSSIGLDRLAELGQIRFHRAVALLDPRPQRPSPDPNELPLPDDLQRRPKRERGDGSRAVIGVEEPSDVARMLEAVFKHDQVVAGSDVARGEQRAVRVSEALLNRPGDTADDELRQ